MSRPNRPSLAERVASAAEAALADHDHVSPLDVIVGIRWIDGGTVKRWQQAQIESLEAAMQINPARIAEALALFRVWADNKGLLSSETPYVARTPQRQALRFSRSGDPATEAAYRTHFVSSALSDKQRERVTTRASRPPELLVIMPLNDTWKCHRCGNTGDLLVMENEGPACLRCVGLDDLEFLPAGDALLSRRARAKSARSAVVVRFSRNRKRYERQGLLVEKPALEDAQREVEVQRD